MPVRNEVPIKHHTKFKETDLKHVSIKCTSASGEAVKEDAPTYNGRDSAEVFMFVVDSLKTIVTRCNWFNSSMSPNGIAIAFETIDRATMGGALTVWQDEVNSLTGNKTRTKHKRCLKNLIEELWGSEIGRVQL